MEWVFNYIISSPNFQSQMDSVQQNLMIISTAKLVDFLLAIDFQPSVKECHPPGRMHSSEFLVSRMSFTLKIPVGTESVISGFGTYETLTSPKPKPFSFVFETYEREIQVVNISNQ